MLSLIRRFPRNLWVLAVCQFLLMSATSMMILVGGLLGAHLAPQPRWATLPITAVILGVATATIPAALLMRRFGRKAGTYLGLTLMLLGALLCFYAATFGYFSRFLLGAFLVGLAMAFVHQFRFAAMESLDKPEDAGPALSLLMLSGIFAAFLGPELGIAGKDLVASAHGYAGSFLLLAVVILLAMIVFSRFENPANQVEEQLVAGRPISALMRAPKFIIAVTAGAVSYGVMSLLMTATPISMHEMQGHSLVQTKWVIQSHIVAMFLPSLVSGFWIKRFGLEKLLLTGTLVYAVTLVIAWQGQAVMHYWLALVLLGVGWNFLFLAGTVLLPESYQPEERFKAQAANEFVIFGVQALTSLSAGWLIFQLGWISVVALCAPFVLIVFGATLWMFWLRKRESISAAQAGVC